MPRLSQTFSLNLPNMPLQEAYRVARGWLVSIGAKDFSEAPPTGVRAVFGSSFTFGWTRNAKKVLQLQFEPVGGGTVVHLRIELTVAHADEAAMFGDRIVASWREFANELWQLYGGGTVTSSPVAVPVARGVTPLMRGGMIGLSIIFFLVAFLLFLAGLRGFLLATLVGGCVGGGAAALAMAIIWK